MGVDASGVCATFDRRFRYRIRRVEPLGANQQWCVYVQGVRRYYRNRGTSWAEGHSMKLARRSAIKDEGRKTNGAKNE